MIACRIENDMTGSRDHRRPRRCLYVPRVMARWLCSVILIVHVGLRMCRGDVVRLVRLHGILLLIPLSLSHCSVERGLDCYGVVSGYG
jgi:hypothetical protein